MVTDVQGGARRERDVAVTLSTRIALSKRDLIDDVVQREGISIREVIEQALEAKWGSGASSAGLRKVAVNE